MIKELINNIRNMEKNILEIMINGLKISFGIAILSSVILLFYILNPISYIIFESGITLFKIGLIFALTFLICAIFTNRIIKEIKK